MKLEIVKQKRKTMVLKVYDSETAILKVPQNLSDKKIDEFLSCKKNWLAKVSNKMKIKEDLLNSFEFSKFIYVNGKKFLPVEEIEIGFNSLSNEANSKSIRKYYFGLFSRLEMMSQKISVETNLGYKELKLLDSIRVWGSFNEKGQMKLNWKLIILPERLIYYVICHELCHSLHMNHKPQFWKDVEKICPDYKILKKELSQYSFVLKSKF